MEDNKQTTPVVETPATTNSEDKKGGNKSFSQADMDNLAGKIRSEEKVKNDQAIKDAVAIAIAEYERNAKLTEEEREKEARSKREAELQAREDDITLRERKIQAKELLDAEKTPTSLVELVVDLDENKMKDKIKQLAKEFHKAVENGVTEKLKGTPPKDFSSNENKDTDTKKYGGTVAF